MGTTCRQAPISTSAAARGVVDSKVATVAGELVVRAVPEGETRRMLLQPLVPSMSTEHNLLTLPSDFGGGARAAAGRRCP